MKYTVFLSLIFMLFCVFLFGEERVKTPEEIYVSAMGLYDIYGREKEAFELFAEAHSMGYAPATVKYAQCLRFGRGTKKDTEKSDEILADILPSLTENARKDMNIAYELGNMLLMGIGTEKKKYEGYRYLLMSAEKENIYAVEAVGVCCLVGAGRDKSVPEAFRWFEKGLEKGSLTSQYYVALCTFTGMGTKRNIKKGIEIMSDCAEKGNPEAVFYMGTLYQTGNGVTKDEKKAFEFFVSAGERGHARAMYNVAKAYLSGTGTDKDEAKGWEWMNRAADAGDSIAINKLADERERLAEEAKKKK